ncbi:hypothetical protein DSM43519_01665 [Mycobacterium marinum]|nr:hypothetical protein CCUG20998_03521 [Mycobacterium marinum]RFZ25479.1 hypothetical protein DSM43519_01665 [Mycobacterium marinum]RFZ28366.1 hypothetical protein DSM44344_01411 [Mycobacterium marinum]
MAQFSRLIIAFAGAIEPDCVCGCPHADHQPVVMSVPLKPRAPLYPIPAGLVNCISTTRPGATYDRLGCRCGCGDYLADSGP